MQTKENCDNRANIHFGGQTAFYLAHGYCLFYFYAMLKVRM